MKLSRPLSVVLLAGGLILIARPVSAHCGTPQAEPTCPTTTSSNQTTTSVGPSTTATTIVATTAVPEVTTTVSVTEAATTTVEATTATTGALETTSTTAAFLVQLCDADGTNCAPFEAASLPSTGNETGVLITAGIVALLSGVYLVARARKAVR